MKQILILTLLLAVKLFAQPESPGFPNRYISGNFYKAEVHTVQSGNAFSGFYIYKIPFSQLFFEKDGDNYKAGLKVNIEISDLAGIVIKRAFDEKSVNVHDYESTNSEKLYLYGLVRFDVPEGNYKVSTIISDKISKRERKLPATEFLASKNILQPIVVESVENYELNSDSLILSISGSVIPFNKPENDLLIPVVMDSTVQSLKIIVKDSDKKIVLEKEISNYFYKNLSYHLSDKGIFITDEENNSSYKIFVVNDIASGLDEGNYTFEILPDNELSKKADFKFLVVWISKPFSLIDPERAMKYLEIIEPEEKISELKRIKGNAEKILYDYWKPFDTTPDTKYNELMNEFYQRVDYAEENFRSITGNGGAFSDRGNIYIKFGKPDETLRDTNSDGKVVETWLYKEQNLKFAFVDSSGTGKFILVNQK